MSVAPVEKRHSPNEKPDKLFRAFVAAYQAKEQWKASDAAHALVLQRERALPVLPKVLQFVKAVPTDTVADGQSSMYWNDAAKILASLGPVSAVPLADMISAGEAKNASVPIGVIRTGTNVIGANAQVTEDLIFTSVPVSRFDAIADAFRQLSVEAMPAVPKLIKLMDSPSWEIRAEACRCIAPIGPRASAATLRLQALCGDVDAHCRQEALAALARVEIDPPRVVPLLASALSDSSEDVRREALKIIAAIGLPAASLSDQILARLARTDLDPAKLQGAEEKFLGPQLKETELGEILRALGSSGLRDAQQCDLLVDLLTRPDARINAQVRRAMGKFLSDAGSSAHPAIERWVRATVDTDDETQIVAMTTAAHARPMEEGFMRKVFERASVFQKKYIPAQPSAREWLTGGAAPRQRSPMEEAARELLYALDRWEVEWSKTRPTNGSPLPESTASTAEVEHLIAQFTAGNEDERIEAVRFLGQIGPQAGAAVPALQSFVESWQFSISPPDLNAIEGCYVALARIAGDPERWIQDAEKRILVPMLALPKRDVWAMGSFTVAIRDIGGSRAFPHLIRWMNGDDAAFAREAMESVIVHGASDSDWAVQGLPIILKNRNFDVDHHHRFAQFVTAAGPAGAPAMNVLVGCVEKYRRRSTDPVEQEKWGKSGWSRYSGASENQLRELLAAFRAIGGTEAQKAVPVLLKLYEEEPVDGEWAPLYGTPLRCEILETLRLLGVDIYRQAAKWVPKLSGSLETAYPVRERLIELGAYGKLATPALPAIIRYTRLNSDNRQEALDALAKIAPDDARVKALRHVAHFDRKPE
ncbi:MAG: HEAT repeat domain-containing protein [Chthoniobacter sp.]|uniref:HEAT repeat domain-containing protein n=1 Tax=Chthoniobacter sp. TaxID=2510640 RepID=UPI0032A82932